MNLEEYFPKLIDKRVPISALKIPPRVFLNWKKEGVIDIRVNNETTEVSNNRKTNRKWEYLDAFDTLWLLIVKDLRRFNLDLKTIIRLKEYLFNVDYIKEMASRINDEELQIILQSTATDEMKSSQDISRLNLGMINQIDDFEEEHKKFFSLIGNSFYMILVLKYKLSILIYKDKDSDQIEFKIYYKEALSNLSSQEVVFTDMHQKFSNDFFINVPLVNYFKLMFEDENLDKYNSHFDFFNYREQKILELLRNDDYKEIIIKKGNDGFLHLESKSQQEFKDEKAKEIRRAIGLKEYDRIELIQRNDKHIVINKTNREKL